MCHRSGLLSFTHHQPNFLPGVILDLTPWGKKFGDLSEDVQKTYSIQTAPVVSATFWGANPRVNFAQQTSFLFVDQRVNGFVSLPSVSLSLFLRNPSPSFLVLLSAYPLFSFCPLFSPALTLLRYCSAWVTVANDADVETRFTWRRVSVAYSQVTVEWHVPLSTVAGTYRLRVAGQAKELLGKIAAYSGASSSFTVTA